MPRNTGPFSHIKSCRLLQQHLNGATNIVVRRLQSVLNAAARLISNKRKFDHITPVLRDQLHWLPIHQRIEFKIAVFVRNAVHGRGPTYLSRTCNLVREVGARAHLRSAVRGGLTVPRNDVFDMPTFQMASSCFPVGNRQELHYAQIFCSSVVLSYLEYFT